MCLVTNWNKTKVLDKSKTVYKVLKRHKEFDIYITPCQYMIMWIGILYGIKSLQIDKYALKNAVKEGFHSFRYKKDAFVFAEKLSRRNVVLFPKYDYVVARCEIPAGSEYCYGESVMSAKSYCSNRIIVKEIL